MSEERINRLSERFRRHEKSPISAAKRNRGRRSFYVDLDVVERLDQTYLAVRHNLYPQDISKSEFLEAILEYGLENLDQIQSNIGASHPDGTSETAGGS